MYPANLIKHDRTCFVGWYWIPVYKATLGLAVFYLWGGVGARHFASLATQMDQLSGLTRKIDLHVWFSAARLFSPPCTASFFWIFCWTWNMYIMKLCVIYEESTLFVRHIGFSVVKKKAAYHSAGSNARDFWLWDHWSWFWVVLLR